jgi:hypothetical protein
MKTPIMANGSTGGSVKEQKFKESIHVVEVAGFVNIKGEFVVIRQESQF